LSAARPLRLLAVTLRYPPYVAGGYELLTRDAVEALRARGHDVCVLAGRGERLTGVDGVLPWLEPELDAGDPFERALQASNLERTRLHFLRRANLHATRRALQEVRPDVLVFFNLGLVSLAPILAARRAGVPTLGYVSDPWPANHWVLAWRATGPGHKRLRRGLLERAWRGFRSHVDLGPLLCCSAHLAHRLAGEGLPPKTLQVLHLGVPPDVEERTAALEPPRRAPDEPLRVACISALWRGKGQDVLLRALADVRARGLPVELWLAAPSETSEFRRELGELMATHQLADAVEVLEGLPRAELSARLARSHVLVVPSVWQEPYPLSTLEGMAHGLAVVVSDAGGTPEAVDAGHDGCVFPAGDAAALADVLAELAADEEARHALGRAAQARARERSSHAAFVDGLERALREVLGGTG